VPPWLAKFVTELLRKAPAERPQTASEVLEQLKSATSSAAAVPLVRPHRVLWIAGTAFAFIILLVSVPVGFNVGGWRTRLLARGQGTRIESLAVLPLKNFSADPEQEYFADGMTEALITNLAKIGALRVISATSVMQYKGVKKPLPQIARELNVDAVVEGSVQRSGNRARITAQLIEAATDRHLWADSYERELHDVLALESELARAIASEVRIKVTPLEQRLLASTRTVNPEAHEAYLKGLYYFNDARDHIRTKRGNESFQKSIDYSRQAVQIDPNFALGYAQLASTYHWIASVLLRGGPIAESKTAARKAIELDDSLAEAHAALAYVMYRFDADWAGAEREFKRAIELNPGYGGPHHGYALYLRTMGRLEEAIAEINKALLLDPLTLPQKVNAAAIFSCARQYDRALEQLRTTLALNPDNSSAQLLLGTLYVLTGKHAEGVSEIQKVVEATDGKEGRGTLAWAYAVTGRRDEAVQILGQLTESAGSEQTLIIPWRALIYAALGDQSNAIAWLEKFSRESPAAVFGGFVRCDETLQSLRPDPRVQEMFRRLRLPP
jgi:TolB-like protein/Tfp pilus assembly protein PilF